MTFKIPLRVLHVDLADSDLIESNDVLFEDVMWTSSSGLTVATLFLEGDVADLVGACLSFVRKLRHLIPNALVKEVHEELVGVPDIAARCAVTVESARMWADGKRRNTPRHPFPPVNHTVTHGSNDVRLYAWRDVLAWIRDVVEVDPEPGVVYLPDPWIYLLDSLIQQAQSEERSRATSRSRAVPVPITVIQARTPPPARGSAYTRGASGKLHAHGKSKLRRRKTHVVKVRLVEVNKTSTSRSTPPSLLQLKQGGKSFEFPDLIGDLGIKALAKPNTKLPHVLIGKGL